MDNDMKKERTRLSRNNLLFLAGGILIGFSLSLIPNLLQTATAPTVTGPQSTVAKFDLPSFAPFGGSNSAQINLVEFGDYQCPFCARFFLLTEPQVLQNYANGGKLKFYFLDLTVIGADSLTLAQGAWCANEQGEYYQYHDYVFSHQGTENSGWGNASKVKSFVGNVSGLDPQKFGSCLDSGKYQSRVSQLTQLAENITATGTQTIFVGNSEIGYIKIVGAQPYSVYQQVIDSQLQLVKGK